MMVMAKKNPDRHKKARKGVQMPEDWYAVAEDLAGDGKMPVLWLIIDLLKKAAEAAGKKDLPAPPWPQKQTD